MKYETVITDRDPTLDKCEVYVKCAPITSRLDAESNARVLAKDYRGFGSVHNEAGESVYEVNFTYQDTDEEITV